MLCIIPITVNRLMAFKIFRFQPSFILPSKLPKYCGGVSWLWWWYPLIPNLVSFDQRQRIFQNCLRWTPQPLARKVGFTRSVPSKLRKICISDTAHKKRQIHRDCFEFQWVLPCHRNRLRGKTSRHSYEYKIPVKGLHLSTADTERCFA